MLGRDAGAEANSILRDGRVIDRRNPKPAAPQFMTEPIHSLPIADDERHDVGRRCSGIDPELTEFFMEVVRVFPQDLS